MRSLIDYIGLFIVVVVFAILVVNSTKVMDTFVKTGDQKIFVKDDKTSQTAWYTYEKSSYYKNRDYITMRELFISFHLDGVTPKVGVALKNGKDNIEDWTADEIRGIKKITFDLEFKRDKRYRLEQEYNNWIQGWLDKSVKSQNDVIYVYDKTIDPDAPYLLYLLS